MQSSSKVMTCVKVKVMTHQSPPTLSPHTESKHMKIYFLLTINICLRLCSEGGGIVNMAKWRNSLGVVLFLPPPGGAQAAAKVTSCWNKQVALLIHNTCNTWRILYECSCIIEIIELGKKD